MSAVDPPRDRRSPGVVACRPAILWKEASRASNDGTRTLDSLTFFALILVTCPANADLIADGDLENPVTPSGGFLQYFGGQNIGGAWNVVGNDVLLINTNYTEVNSGTSATMQFNAAGGSNALDITGAGNTGLTDGINQTVTTVAGQGYLLTFDLGHLLGDSRYATPAIVNLSINNGSLIPFINSNSTLNQVNWQQYSASFVATGASTSIAFFNGTTTTNYVGLDDVSLVATPEPGTLATTALGGMLCLGAFWRRRSRPAAR